MTRRLDQLPNSAGQVWREYDITPYTSRVTTTENPQQAILDWILRETGNEMWFNEPLGILHANRSQLYVYHTPEIQQCRQTNRGSFCSYSGTTAKDRCQPRDD